MAIFDIKDLYLDSFLFDTIRNQQAGKIKKWFWVNLLFDQKLFNMS